MSWILNISHPRCAVREHYLCRYFAVTPSCEWRLWVERDFSSISCRTSPSWLVSLACYSHHSLPILFPFLGSYWKRSERGGLFVLFFYAVVSNPWVSGKATCGEHGSNWRHAHAASRRQMHFLKRKKRKTVSLRFCVSDWNKTCLSNTSSYLYLRSAGVIDILRQSAGHRTNIDALARHKSVSLDPGRPISTNGMNCHRISFKLQYILWKKSASVTFYQ